ncbi:GerMN domain-containing protein [Ornithinimicrobium sp. Arc0846-15]|nr:GerMN domain-containing protein [Ornithinimicrobium laminariae]
MRRFSPLAAVVALVLLLSACAGLPMYDAPQPGEPVLGAPDQDIQSQPDLPREGAPADEIWRGFLLANGSSTDGYEVAREYLSDDLAVSWVPTSNVVIRSGDAQVAEIDNIESGTIEATITVDSVLGGDGNFIEFDGEETQTESFTLNQIAGEWRITELPDGFGLWLSETEFDRQFRKAEISYVSATEDIFVSDSRWFPRADGFSTALARALLEPTPAYLDGAVRTGVVEGMDLAAGGVPIDVATSTATVNLRGPGLADDEDRVRMLWAQFTQTLTQVGGVDQVVLQLNGQPLELPEGQEALDSAAALGFETLDPLDEYGLVRNGTSLALVNPDDHALAEMDPEVEGIEIPASVSQKWEALAVDESLSTLAGVDEDRETLWLRGDNGAQQFGNLGTSLTDPQLVGDGTVWIGAARGSTPAVWVLDADAGEDQEPTRLEAEWLTPDLELHQLSVSPDGSRVAVLNHPTDGGADEIGIAGIVRNADGEPIGLAPPRREFAVFETVDNASWATDESLVVLGKRAEDTDVRPFVAPLNDRLEPLGEAPSAQTVQGFLTEAGLQAFVVTTDGTVLTREGAGWQSYREGDDLVVPGK